MSQDGALFVWSCSKNMDDLKLKDRDQMEGDAGLRIVLNPELV